MCTIYLLLFFNNIQHIPTRNEGTPFFLLSLLYFLDRFCWLLLSDTTSNTRRSDSLVQLWGIYEKDDKRIEEEEKKTDTLTLRQLRGNKHIHLCHTQRARERKASLALARQSFFSLLLCPKRTRCKGRARESLECSSPANVPETFSPLLFIFFRPLKCPRQQHSSSSILASAESSGGWMRRTAVVVVDFCWPVKSSAPPLGVD